MRACACRTDRCSLHGDGVKSSVGSPVCYPFSKSLGGKGTLGASLPSVLMDRETSLTTQHFQMTTPFLSHCFLGACSPLAISIHVLGGAELGEGKLLRSQSP